MANSLATLVALSLSCTLFAGSAAAEDTRLVAAIEWAGVSQVEVSELEKQILTTRKSWKPWADSRPYDPSTLDQDLERIRRFYRRQGFFEAAVEGDATEKGRKEVVVHFAVEEGPEVVLAALALTFSSEGRAAAPLDVDAIRAELGLASGDRFGADAYRQAKEALLKSLAKSGYPAALITGGAEVRLEEHEADIEWTVTLGPFVRLGAATVSGLEKVAPELVEREVTWRPGDPYDPAVLRNTQRAIYRLGLFRSVAVVPLKPTATPDPSGPVEQSWPMEIRVDERLPHKLRVGVGFGTEDRFRAKVEWKHRNFFGDLRSLRIGAKYSFLESGVETVFVQPRFLDPETDLTLDSLVSIDTTPAYDGRGVSAGWLLERPLWKGWEGRFGQRYEWKRVTHIEADVETFGVDEDEAFQLVFFNLGVRRSALDSKLNPRSGTWLDFSVEPSTDALGSDINYVKTTAEARVFLPLPKQVVLASRLRLGALEPFAGNSALEVPVFKRFFAGGSSTVRGFALDKLGPLDDDGEPFGGLTSLVANTELRFPIWRGLGGVVFTDAGQVALDSFSLREGDFYYSAGAGLRYNTPIGPLRLDFAQILNPPSELSSFRVHFSIGQAF